MQTLPLGQALLSVAVDGLNHFHQLRILNKFPI